MLPVFSVAASAELITLIRFVGALWLSWGFTLFVNRWNTVNGKAAALGCVIVAVTAAYTAYTNDKNEFKPRSTYIFAALYFISALQLAFNANPTYTWQSLKAAEDAKKEKEAAKSK